MAGRRRVTAGAVVLVCSLQYFLAEQIAAGAWRDPAYSWTRDYISELGAVECGKQVCSPLHVVVPASLALQAALVVSAAALLSSLARTRAVRGLVRSLAAVHAVGDVIVAAFPWQPEPGANTLHYLGAALAATGGVALMVVLGADALRVPRRRAYGALSLCCALVSLAALVLLRWNTTYDAGLPDGLLERLAIDPIVVWLAGTGLALLYATTRGRGGGSARTTGTPGVADRAPRRYD